jgi:hypothetical protein
MADCGYLPEQPGEGTCARDCNYLIFAVVTKPGPTAKERWCRYFALIEYKPQRCQRRQLEHVPNSRLDVSINGCQLFASDTSTVTVEQ